MKAIWTGSIGFGLVNIPIKMYSAVEESTLGLDMLDKKDHANIKFKRVNENTGKEVAWENIVKGYLLNNKYVVLACGTEKQWLSLCKVLDLEHLIEDNRFKTNASRVKNRAELYAILRGVMEFYERDALINLFKKHQIPVGAIRNMPEVFENKTAQDMILEDTTHKTVVTKCVKTVAFKIF